MAVVRSRPALLRFALLTFGAALLFTFGATAAGADTGPTGNNTDYTRQAVPIADPAQRPPAPPAAAPATAAPAAVSPSRWLPVTGADIGGLAALASVLLVSGVILTRVRRRQAS